MLAAIVRASLGHPRIVTALACLIALLGLAALRLGALRCVSGFRSAARAGADRGARPRCDPSRGSGHAAARGSPRRHREREDGALDLEPGPFGDASRLRSHRRSLPAAPSGDRAPRRDRRRAARGDGRAASLAVELVDGIPRAFRVHQRPALGRGIARHRAMDREAANSRRTRRRASTDLRRRRARAPDRSRSGQARCGGSHAGRCGRDGKTCHHAHRRRLPGNSDPAYRDPRRRRPARRSRLSATPSSARMRVCLYASRMSPWCATAPSRASAMR